MGFDHWSAANIAFLAVSVAVGIGFGMMRGASTVLFEKDGTLHQRYTVKTLIVWGLSLAASAGLHFGAQAIGAEEVVRPITLSIGLSLLGEAITCGWRGQQTGIPFAVKDSGRRGDDIGDRLSGIFDSAG
ncbi:hypothetical protein [Brevibacterium oceani]|uniref:hypothetical protein n=1 Tax=Brevibacterium oceani TaxID=358099 RepID=UPI0015E7AA26|nr:hypothetical protein [Brevibacterium oceani]